MGEERAKCPNCESEDVTVIKAADIVIYSCKDCGKVFSTRPKGEERKN